ncbi:ATP-binding cassette domain-containing protein [Sinorhizobium meliloti]|uniref:ATP-binding cassette domain-containing protein n=1 Tax=Rhizobium meliloti TaxID=382 RepID=UPI0012964C88|nr:ATP-binding cassette domain-containing protein [Sinorhizobium meliloti]MQU68395.1 ATP-binding cassette domain-containing protein [Sinorhizobium meliloti]
MTESFVSIRNLYKIFGPSPKSMISHAKSGLGKEEMLRKYGHVLGLRDINVEIQKGKITVIMGLSGSGKSTLIRHFNRLIDPTDGQVVVNKVDITKLGPSELRQLRRTQMSMVFQKFALFPHETVLNNIGTPCSVRGDDPKAVKLTALKWLGRVGLAGTENMYPHQLSGGMQQRVGLARALASNSEIMLMDEAYSALDPIIRSSMQDLLLELQKDLHKTVVFITHDLDEALKIADHLVILKDGEVVQQGDPQAIMLNPSNEYVKRFVSEINRLRVIRVRSVMDVAAAAASNDVIDGNVTLERAIGAAMGDANKVFDVQLDGKHAGSLRMENVLKVISTVDDIDAQHVS